MKSSFSQLQPADRVVLGSFSLFILSDIEEFVSRPNLFLALAEMVILLWVLQEQPCGS